MLLPKGCFLEFRKMGKTKNLLNLRIENVVYKFQENLSKINALTEKATDKFLWRHLVRISYEM